MTRKEKAEHWRKHVEAWQTSGMTRRCYCVEHGLAVSTFDRWHKRLKDGEGVRESKLIPIAPATVSRQVTVHLSNGIRLETPLELLREVLAMVCQRSAVAS